MPHHIKGVSLFVLSMFFFSMTYAFYKACDPFLPHSLIVFFQNLCSWLIILPFTLSKGFKALATHHLGMIVLRSILGIGSLYCISWALLTINFSEVVLLNNTAPLFIPLIVWFWHKHKILLRTWIGIIIGFAGVVIILRPSFQQVEPGLFIALFSGLCAGAMLVVLRHISTEPFLRILFYYFMISWLALIPFLFAPWQSPPPQIWIFLGLAGICMVVAQALITVAVKHGPSHELAPFIYTGVLFAAGFDWLIWNVKPDLIATLGMFVTFVGCIVTLKKAAI